MARIFLGNLTVDEMTHSSGVFSGNNKQYKWDAVVKHNHGFGMITGDSNRYAHNFNTVNDSDVYDKKSEND